MFGLSIVTRDVASRDKVILGYDLERRVAERLGNGIDRLRKRAHVDGMTASGPVMAAHVGRYPSQAALVLKSPGQSLGFPETPFDSPEFCQRVERVSEVEADVDGLL